MAAFGKLQLTMYGEAMQSSPVFFTRIAIGDGELGSTNPYGLNTLIHELGNISITSSKRQGNKITLGGLFNNNEMDVSGFTCREIGLYAEDSEYIEHLYAYANSGEIGDYIPPFTDTRYEKYFYLTIAVGSTAIVTINMDYSMFFAPIADFETHVGDYLAHQNYISIGGTSSALTATISGVTLADKYPISFRLISDISENSTLAFNGGTAYPIYTADGNRIKPGAKSGSILSMRFDSANNRWMVENGIVIPTDLYAKKTDFDTHIGAAIRHTNTVTAGGTSAALTATITDVTLVDKFPLNIKLANDIADNATLSFNGGTAYPIYTSDGVQIKAGAKVGTYISVIFDSATNRWYLTGGNGKSIETTAGAQSKADAAKSGAESTAAQALTTHQEASNPHPGLVTTPTGCVEMFAGSTAPSGWLECNGAAVDRTTYAALFSVIGTTYGAGNGTTTFNLPDVRNKSVFGKGSETEFNALGKTGGEKSHVLTKSEMPSHDHDVVVQQNSSTVNVQGNWNTSVPRSGTTTKTTATEGTGAAHNNLPPYIVFMTIIKI